jgi:hypothetical protein
VCVVTLAIIVVIVIFIIIIVSVVVVVVVNNFLNTDSVYNKVVQYNLGVLHYCHVCNCLHTNNILNVMFRCVFDFSIPNFTFPNSSGLLVTAVKPNSRINVQQWSFFYIVQKIVITNIACFLKIYYNMSYWDAKVSGVLLQPHKFACLRCCY